MQFSFQFMLFFIFPQIFAANFCANKNNSDVSPNNMKALRCKLGIGQRQCMNWRIAVGIYLGNTDKRISVENTRNIISFMEQASAYCDSNSYTQLYSPDPYAENKCPKFIPINSTSYSNLTINGINPDSPGYVLYEILNQMKICLGQTPLSSDQGGAAFIFTDLTTEQMCDNMLFANSLNSLIEELIAKKYSVSFLILSGDATSEENGMNKLFKRCTELDDCRMALHSYYDQWSLQGKLFETCPRQNTQNTTESILMLVFLPVGIIVSITLLIVFVFRTQLKLLWQRYLDFLTRKSSGNSLNKFHSKNDYTDPKLSPHKLEDEWEMSLTDVLLKENEILGHGAFGTVFKAIIAQGKVPLLNKYCNIAMTIPSLPDGTYEAAVKRLPEHSTEKSRLDLMSEIKFMKNLGYHPHIISMLGCINSDTDPLLILEYCQHRDLLRFLRRHRTSYIGCNNEEEESDNEGEISTDEIKIKPKNLLSFAWQICDGMTYLASKNIIHRDLAARNILLNQNLVAKIADFGMCRTIKDVFYNSQGGRLPVKWMAPEALQFYEFSEKTDVWAYGVVLFEIFSLGQSPFTTVDPNNMLYHLEQGNRLPKEDTCPDEIYQIMCKCWSTIPDERPDVCQIRLELSKYLNEITGNYNYLDLTSQPAELSS